ncbi:MAG: hypothetical protein CM1200mP10_28550 [Candidatus Neomarinimicrobiota bacterium]|nr:MAG: hypothetical protein CM1200mP10_28550 [Candidatus Neomarinimicrobiota bacterium]
MQKYTMRHATNFKDLRLGGLKLGNIGVKASAVFFGGKTGTIIIAMSSKVTILPLSAGRI